MKILCVFGEHNYGDPGRGIGVEYAAFVPTLERLGHQVLHFESWDRRAYRDLADMNQQLLACVDSFRPDVMLTVQMNYELWIETLEFIKARGDVATVSWTTDDSWKYREVSRFIAHAYDAMTTTYDYRVESYRKDGIDQVLLTQWAVSSDWLASPLRADECRYDVTFVGAAHGDRLAMVDQLRQAGIDIKCFGFGWDGGTIASEDIPRIMRESIVSLNFNNSQGENQIKARMFEVPGAGGFLLTDSARGLERYFDPGKEIVVFNSLDEAIDLIRFYVAQPEVRDRIANAGHSRVRQEHTYEGRLTEVLEFAISSRARSRICVPSRSSFKEAVSAHRLGFFGLFFRKVLTAGARVIFGPDRGPRAARRLVFELSWRILGRHTYTAAGWPGRLFPHD
jgi:spore maturation protein CgeB